MDNMSAIIIAIICIALGYLTGEISKKRKAAGKTGMITLSEILKSRRKK